jgi:hypothetical protein
MKPTNRPNLSDHFDWMIGRPAGSTKQKNKKQKTKSKGKGLVTSRSQVKDAY